MKILSVTTSFPEAYNEDEAYWRRVNAITQCMRENGYIVNTVHYLKEPYYTKAVNEDYFLDTSERVIKISRFSAFINHLKLVKKNHYDIVIGHADLSTFYSIFSKILNVPLIYDMHGASSEEFLMGINKVKTFSELSTVILRKSLCHANLHLSDKILCVSYKMMHYLNTKKKIPLKTMIYLPNCVDLNFLDESKIKEEDIQILKDRFHLTDKFVFGYIGHHHPWQGVDKLITVAKKVVERNKDVTFLFVGINKESTQRNIIFIPRVPHNDIPMYYSLCDVLILPRPYHLATEVAAPTKFAEYSAMSKPVLTTNVGDAAKLVMKYNSGIVVENNHPENLKKGILEFLTMDKDQLTEMGKNSRKLAENEFDREKISKNLIKCLDEVVIK
jgi:glycosyltransferase involved in cell wall biosynthesis